MIFFFDYDVFNYRLLSKIENLNNIVKKKKLFFFKNLKIRIILGIFYFILRFRKLVYGNKLIRFY